MWQRQCLSEIRAQPWRNGQGVTRLIAEETTSGAGLQWRLSVADILDDAPFSRFPGWWRYFAILSQGEVALSAKDKSWCHLIKNKSIPIEFSGDEDVLSTCSAGGVQALNLMIKDEKYNVKKIDFSFFDKQFSFSGNNKGTQRVFIFPSVGRWVLSRNDSSDMRLLPGEVWSCVVSDNSENILIPQEKESSLFRIIL